MPANFTPPAAIEYLRFLPEILLTLAYDEDSSAQVDMNVVKTGSGRFVEVQGTAEESPFGDDDLSALLSAADKGIRELVAHQRKVLGDLALRKKPNP